MVLIRLNGFMGFMSIIPMIIRAGPMALSNGM